MYDFLGEPHEQDSVSFIRDRSPINSSFDAGSRSAGERWAAWGLEERRRFHDIAGDQLIRFGMERDDSWVLNGMTAGKDVR